MAKRNLKKELPYRVYIACGDLHAEKNTPRYRSDNYWETWQRKMAWVINYANERNARLLIAGDIFNTSRVQPDVTNVVLDLFLKAHMAPYVVAGQHDLKYHTSLEKCPLYTLELAGAVKIINGIFEDFAGAGFEEPIPEEKAKFLITHTTITESTPPFFLEDAIPAKKFMRMNPQFEIIISGDYHVPFVKILGNQILINTGTLIRNKKDMHGYVPYIWEVCTGESGTVVEKIKVPHEPYNEVFDTEAMAYDEDHGIVIDTERLKEMIDSGVENDDIESIVMTIYRKLKAEGVPIDKKLMLEVLESCK